MPDSLKKNERNLMQVQGVGILEISNNIQGLYQTRKGINLGSDSEFNSRHFCIEINKCLKFVRLKNKFIRKINNFF